MANDTVLVMKVVVRIVAPVQVALCTLGFVLLGCQSHQGATSDAGSGGVRDAASTSQGGGSGGAIGNSSGGKPGTGTGGAGATTGAGGASGGSGTGGASAPGDGGGSTLPTADAAYGDAALVDAKPAGDARATPPTDGGNDAPLDTSDAATVSQCSPGVTVRPGSAGNIEVSCNNYGWELGVPNGEAVFASTFVLPSSLVPGADNALSFVLTGAGPYNFELWGTDTPCKAEELLWWGPFGAGTQCAQFKPSKPYADVLFVYRKLYAASYSFGTPSTTLCPGGTCPGGSTGTGKTSDTPLTAPLGNYALNRFDQLAAGWEIFLGYSGRMTVAAQGETKKAGVAQPLAAGVFRLPSTDPYGDAWYCIGEGSTLTQIEKDGWFKGVQFSLRGITRLGECGDAPGTGSLSATLVPSSTTGTYFAGDVAGTISSWTGSNFAASVSCSGVECDIRLRGTPQQHFIHATTSVAPDSAAPTPVAVDSATWLVQADSSQPFAMACSSSGSLLYSINASSKLELSKMSSPRACPGTPVANSSLDFMADYD